MSKVLDVFYEDRYCEVCKSNNEHLIQKVDEEDNGEYVGYYAECLICNNVEDITFYVDDNNKEEALELVKSGEVGYAEQIIQDTYYDDADIVEEK